MILLKSGVIGLTPLLSNGTILFEEVEFTIEEPKEPFPPVIKFWNCSAVPWRLPIIFCGFKALLIAILLVL
jgi:hypothetical protein